MKKLVFMFVAVAAISFASCGNKAQQAPVRESSGLYFFYPPSRMAFANSSLPLEELGEALIG